MFNALSLKVNTAIWWKNPYQCICEALLMFIRSSSELGSKGHCSGSSAPNQHSSTAYMPDSRAALPPVTTEPIPNHSGQSVYLSREVRDDCVSIKSHFTPYFQQNNILKPYIIPSTAFLQKRTCYTFLNFFLLN